MRERGKQVQKMAMNKHLPIMDLINGLSAAIKRYRIAEWTGKKKKSQCSISHIRQNRLQKKGHKKRPRKSIHNTQGKNPSRRYKHCKYKCTQHRSTQIHKENLGGLQERYPQQHNYTRRFQHTTVKNG